MALSDVTSDQRPRGVIRRIILVGDAMVGKTGLVDRFFRNTFNEPSVLVGSSYSHVVIVSA